MANRPLELQQRLDSFKMYGPVEWKNGSKLSMIHGLVLWISISALYLWWKIVNFYF